MIKISQGFFVCSVRGCCQCLSQVKLSARYHSLFPLTYCYMSRQTCLLSEKKKLGLDTKRGNLVNRSNLGRTTDLQRNTALSIC